MTPLPPDTDERLKSLEKEIDSILSDSEEFSRLVSRINPRDILESFTI